MLTDVEIIFDGQSCNGKQPEIQWNCPLLDHSQVVTSNSTAGFGLDLEQGSHIIRFDFLNKALEDTTELEDLAVIIKDIRINGISDEKIFNHTVYRPAYPEPWFSQQSKTKPESVLYGHRYLGWNGSWELEFSVPAFQWLHQTIGFGWHY